jgi:quercetin dioxygenase-like cupin family protein
MPVGLGERSALAAEALEGRERAEMPAPHHEANMRLLPAIFLAILMLPAAQAQDPTKVEPKHYKLDFENEHVQVVSVHYGPHEKSAMHEHPGGVVVVINAGHLLFTDEKGKVREVYAKAGEARWFPPFKHRVENVGDTAYDAVYVGIKGMSGGAKGVAEVGGAAGVTDLESALSATGLDAETRRMLAGFMAAAGQ